MNLTPNSTCGGVNCVSTKEQVFFGFLCGGIILVGLLGNLFVIWAIVGDRSFRSSVMNIMLLNLAIADFGNLLTCSPDLIQLLNDRGWIYPAYFCPIFRYFQVVFLYNSVFTQLGITIERYLAICSPLQVSRISHRDTGVIIVVLWLLSVALALPYGLFMRSAVRRSARRCLYIPGWRKVLQGFKDAEFICMFCLPLIIMSTLYIRTGKALWGRSSGRQLYQNQLTKYLSILRRRRSVIKMLVLCVAIYFLCYSPLQILSIVHHFIRVRVPTIVRLVLNALTLASSAANPIVYTICYDQFRMKLQTLLKIRKSKNDTGEEFPTQHPGHSRLNHIRQALLGLDFPSNGTTASCSIEFRSCRLSGLNQNVLETTM